MTASRKDDDEVFWMLHDEDLIGTALPDGRYDPPVGHPDRRPPGDELPGPPPGHPEGPQGPPNGEVREPRNPKPTGGSSAAAEEG